MNIACEKCGTSYVVEEARIPASGLRMQCTVCLNTFTVHPPGAGPGAAEQAPQSHGWAVDAGRTVLGPGMLGGGSPLIPPAAVVPPDIGSMVEPNQHADLPAPIGPPKPPPIELPNLGSSSASGPGLKVGSASLPAMGDLPVPPGSSDSGRALPPPIETLPAGNIRLDAPSGVLPVPKRAVQAPVPAAPGIDLSDFDVMDGRGRRAGAVDLPAPVGVTDLPAPLSGASPPPPPGSIDLPAPRSPAPPPPPGVTDLPAPLGPTQRAKPAAFQGLTDLPTPRGLVDLPAPAPGVTDLPRPAPGVTDLPRPSPGLDVLQPLESSGGLGYGNVSLSDPGHGPLDLEQIPVAAGGRTVAGVGGGLLPSLGEGAQASVGRVSFADDTSAREQPLAPGRSGKAGEVELPAGLVDLLAPTGGPVSSPGEPIVDRLSDDLDTVQFHDLPTQAARRHADAGLEPQLEEPSLPGPRHRRGLVIGVGFAAILALAGVALGLFTDFGFFGAKLLLGDTGRAAQAALDVGRKLMARDTIAGYKDAERQFGELAQAKANTAAAGLRIQARLARIIRFDADAAALAEAEQQLSKLLEDEDQPPIEILKARGLLELAKPNAAPEAVATLSHAVAQAPKDAFAALYLGWADQRSKRLDDAKSAFSNALAADGRLVAAMFGLADIAAAKNDIDSALTWVKKAIAANPDHTSAVLLRAQLLMKTHNAEQAEALLARLLASPQAMAKHEQSEAHTLKALLAEQSGQIDQANDHYDAALKADANNVAAMIGSGRLLLRAKQYSRARQRFERALARDPSNGEAVLLLANATLAMGKPLDARNALQAMLKQAPKDARVRFALARVEESVGELDDATKLFNDAITLDDHYFEPYLYLSRLYLKRDNRSLAFATLKQAGNLIPGARTRNALGEAYHRVGELARARTEFEAALVADPTLNVALFNLANTLRDQGKLDEALAKFEELQQRDKAYPQLASNIGLLYMQLGKYKDAAGSYARALEVDAPPAELRLAAARAFLSAGQPKAADEQAIEVLTAEPLSAAARAIRAEAHLRTGHLNDALVEIRQAVRREPKAEYYVVQARVLEALNQTMDALGSYEEAIKLDPNRIDLRLEHARVLVRAGTVKDGLKELEQIIRKKPALARAYLFKGLALADLGQEKQAISAYQAALQRDDTLGEAHFRLGQIYFDTQRLASANTHLQSAVKHADDGANWRPDAYYLLGQVARKRRRREEAIQAFQTFLKIARPRDVSRAEAEKALRELGVAHVD